MKKSELRQIIREEIQNVNKELDEMARAKVIYSLVPAEKDTLQKVIDKVKGTNTKLALQYLLDNEQLTIADLAKDLKKDPATFNNPPFRQFMSDLIGQGIVTISTSFIEKAPKEKAPKEQTPKSEKSKPVEDEDEPKQTAPSEKDIEPEGKFGGMNAQKTSSEEKATFEKIKKAITSKVKKINNMEEGDEKEKEKKMLKITISNPDAVSVFNKLGLNIKDFVNDIIS